MSRTIRLAVFAIVASAGLTAGCKSSGCSSCGAQAPVQQPALGEQAPTVAARNLDTNIRPAAAVIAIDDCTA